MMTEGCEYVLVHPMSCWRSRFTNSSMCFFSHIGPIPNRWIGLGNIPRPRYTDTLRLSHPNMRAASDRPTNSGKLEGGV